MESKVESRSRRNVLQIQGRSTFFALLTIVMAVMITMPTPPLIAMEDMPARALVLEYQDPYTQTDGAADRLQQAGFVVKTIEPSLSFDSAETDLLFLGSFVSEHPLYENFVRENREALLAFVYKGGVLIQMTQADQTESTPSFLPETLSATRGDSDSKDVWLADNAHPLTHKLSDDGTILKFRTYLNHHANWESLQSQMGFKVLLFSDIRHRFALLEGKHGKGRYILSSMALDKLPKPPAVVDPVAEQTSVQFFSNIRDYVLMVKNGTAPEVVSEAIHAHRKTGPNEGEAGRFRKKNLLVQTDQHGPPFQTGSWTLVVLPDTQNYTVDFPQTFGVQTDWIAKNVSNFNIKYVLHVGDIVNDNRPRQWEIAKRAMSRLDGIVPYALAPGNHDYGTDGRADNRSTLLNDYFLYKEIAQWPSFGGAMEKGKLDNTYHLFETGNDKWLILALEWGPRDATLGWANRIIAEYPQRKIIFVTHAYLYNDDSRYDWRLKGTRQGFNPHKYGTAKEGTNDGEELWQKLVMIHPGFAFVISGHALGDGTGRLLSRATNGNIVHQILSNYQSQPHGGAGYLRIMEFRPDKTVQVKTYSPLLDLYRTDPENQFVLRLEAESE